MTDVPVACVFDTWAWVEELGGGPRAEDVYATHLAFDVGTPDIVLAELAHLYAKRMPDKLNLALERVTSTSTVLRLTNDVARAAGRTRARLEKSRKGIGLVDCVVYETARAHDATLLTGGPHLKGLKGVRFLR